MKRIFTALFAALALSSLAATSFAADTATVQATLILGSNEGTGIEPSLRQYAAQLKRRLPQYDSFKRVGGGTARTPTPGSSAIKLGDGQSVTLKIESAQTGRLRVNAQWAKGSKTLVNTTLVVSPGKANALGTQNYILVFSVK